MKLILLAATAMIAVPAIAQTTTPDADTSTQTASPTDQSTTQTPTDQSTMQSPSTTDQSAAPTDQSTMQTPPADQSGSMPTDTSGATPTGGYAPTGAPMQGAAAPGGPVTVQPSMSPSQAFPPPAAQTGPLPFCKAGQYDKCREHSTASGARSHRTPR